VIYRKEYMNKELITSLITLTVITAIVVVTVSFTMSDMQREPNQKLMSDAKLIRSFAEYAQRIARNSGKLVHLRVDKSGDKGHAAIIRDGTTIWELTTDDCLIAPLNYTITFDRNGFPDSPAVITITNGQELYLDILPDGSTQLNSAEL